MATRYDDETTRPRERIMALIEALTQAGAEESRERKRVVREAEQKQARNWGNPTAQGAMTGMMVSGGNPFGALAGGIVGSAKGMHQAYLDRKKSGESDAEALWNTLTDFGAGIPDPGVASQGAATYGMMSEGRRGRGEDGGGARYAEKMKQLLPKVGPGAKPKYDETLPTITDIALDERAGRLDAPTDDYLQMYNNPYGHHRVGR